MFPLSRYCIIEKAEDDKRWILNAISVTYRLSTTVFLHSAAVILFPPLQMIMTVAETAEQEVRDENPSETDSRHLGGTIGGVFFLFGVYTLYVFSSWICFAHIGSCLLPRGHGVTTGGFDTKQLCKGARG